MTGPKSWNDIAGHTLTSLDEARYALSTARDWMKSDWPEGQGPVDHDQRHEAAQMISQAKALIDQAKSALRASAARPTQQ